jgi:hypothetical protein
VLFSRFFETLGAKNTEHTEVFCAQEHGIYNVFATGNKNHGICSVFETSPSKNTSIYAIFDFHLKIGKKWSNNFTHALPLPSAGVVGYIDRSLTGACFAAKRSFNNLTRNSNYKYARCASYTYQNLYIFYFCLLYRVVRLHFWDFIIFYEQLVWT